MSTPSVVLDLNKRAPHSPRNRLAGFAIANRTVDKCRASLAGKLGQYHYDCPLDNSLFSFKGITAGQFTSAGMATERANGLELYGIISAAGANPVLVEEIGRAGPYGAGNPEPVLVAPDLRVAFADTVGKGHIRLRLQGSDGAYLQAIAFRAANGPLGEGLLKSRGKRIHAAGQLRRRGQSVR